MKVSVTLHEAHRVTSRPTYNNRATCQCHTSPNDKVSTSVCVGVTHTVSQDCGLLEMNEVTELAVTVLEARTRQAENVKQSGGGGGGGGWVGGGGGGRGGAPTLTCKRRWKPSK